MSRGSPFLSANDDIPHNNGAILNVAHIVKHILSSATKAKLATLYIMAREAVYIRIFLKEMVHKQLQMSIQIDSTMTEGVINSKIQPKQTKVMDIRFHWLCNREYLEQLQIYWRPGKQH